MIILGIVLLIIGFVAKIAILWTIGIVVVLIGLALAVLGMVGHAVGGAPALLLTMTADAAALGASGGGEIAAAARAAGDLELPAAAPARPTHRGG